MLFEYLPVFDEVILVIVLKALALGADGWWRNDDVTDTCLVPVTSEWARKLAVTWPGTVFCKHLRQQYIAQRSSISRAKCRNVNPWLTCCVCWINHCSVNDKIGMYVSSRSKVYHVKFNEAWYTLNRVGTCLFHDCDRWRVLPETSSSSSTTVGSMPVGVWRHSYYRCPPLPI